MNLLYIVLLLRTFPLQYSRNKFVKTFLQLIALIFKTITCKTKQPVQVEFEF